MDGAQRARNQTRKVKKMAKYQMTAKNNSTIGYWEDCKAETLGAAKREATNEYGAGYNDDVIVIREMVEGLEPVTVASKRNDGSKWVNHEA